MLLHAVIIAHYRKGGSSRIRVHEDLYASVLHRYLKYDGEMSVVMVLWRDCEQLLEKYNDEQVSRGHHSSAMLNDIDEKFSDYKGIHVVMLTYKHLLLHFWHVNFYNFW